MEQLPPRTWVLAASAAGYFCLDKIAHKFGGQIMGQEHWASLDGRRKDRTVLYLLSLVNAAALTGLSAVELYRKYRSAVAAAAAAAAGGSEGGGQSEGLLAFFNRVSRRGIEDPERTTAGYTILHLLCGYMLHDFVKTMLDWANHKDEWLHHAISLGLLFSVFGFARSKQLRSYPGVGASIGIIEASTVPLDIMWLLRETGRSDSRLYRVCSYLFALLFLSVRWCWIPNLIVNLLFKLPDIDRVVFVRPLFYGLCALQYYWGFKIIQALRSGKMG